MIVSTNSGTLFDVLAEVEEGSRSEYYIALRTARGIGGEMIRTFSLSPVESRETIIKWGVTPPSDESLSLFFHEAEEKWYISEGGKCEEVRLPFVIGLDGQGTYFAHDPEGEFPECEIALIINSRPLEMMDEKTPYLAIGERR